MADNRLDYWNSWDILGPGHELLVSLRSPLPHIDEKKLSDIDYLCEMLNEYPYATLRKESAAYKIHQLKQRALTDERALRDLRRVGKAISKIKSKKVIEKQKGIIRRDIEFFKEFLKRDRKKRLSIEAAIGEYLERWIEEDDAPTYNKRQTGDSKFASAYYAYNKVYKKLKKYKLTDPEIFCFFEKAASNIDKPNPMIQGPPCARRLTFQKRWKTWYVWRQDMYWEVGGKAD